MSRQTKRPRQRKHWFYSRWFLATMGVLFILIVASMVKEVIRSYQVKHQISTLQDQISALEDNNRDISRFVDYLKTDTYFEEQARLKFGMKAPGEKELVLEDQQPSSGQAPTAGSGIFAQPDTADPSPNPVLWWRYFFGKG